MIPFSIPNRFYLRRFCNASVFFLCVNKFITLFAHTSNIETTLEKWFNNYEQQY